MTRGRRDQEAGTKGGDEGAVVGLGVAGVGGGRLLTARELAAFFNVAPKTIYDWVAQGLVRPIRLGRGRMLRFDAQDVLRQLTAREEG